MKKAFLTKGFLSHRPPEAVHSLPNLITYIRLTVSMSFFITSIHTGNILYNYIGLGVHWLGDVLDGFIARTFKQETIFGAEIDIIADRVEVLFFFIIFLFFRPFLFLPVALYIIDFAFIDFYLSYQFLKYGLISPNYFYKIDKRVYLLNYSPGGKFCNSTVVTLWLIFLPQLWGAAAGMASILIAIKIYSICRLYRRNTS
jgi:CDP-diacylglycerol---glycerol-3-phosphate 3-phosphatidyltransferase